MQGEVYDNSTGLPLAGATVTQMAPAVTPAPSATTDLRGQFVMPASSGAVTLRISRAGYSQADRTLDAPAGSAAVMFDARLQPQDSAALASYYCSHSTEFGLQRCAGSSGKCNQSKYALKLTRLDGQSLPPLLPDGWAPVGVAIIDTTATLQQDAKLRVSNSQQLPAFAPVMLPCQSLVRS